MRIFCIFWALAMGLFALFQINDPDPVAWTLVYFLCACIWIGEYLQARSWWLNAGVSLWILGWLILIAPAALDGLRAGALADIFQGMRADRPYVESVLEFAGLLLAGGPVAALVWRDRPRVLRAHINTGE